MKKILLALAICSCATQLSAQFVYKIKADSVKITNDSCNAELILENSTRATKGFLYNYGNGRTRFQKGVVKFNDSLYISGDDTINIGSVINRLVAANGLTKIGDSIKLGGSFLAATILNMNGFGLRFNVGSSESSPTTSGRLSEYVNRTQLSDLNDFYINTRYTGSSNFGGGDGSIFVENFWNPTATISSGGYANFFSQHKSNISGLNMAGVKLYGFRSRFRVNNTNQTFGDWYHFYAGTSPDLTLGSLNNYYGLYVESLKIPNTINAYAIYSAGADDSVYNAGPVRWTKYKNNGSEDSVLTTDASGNLKLKLIASSAWSLLGNSATNPSTNFLGTTDAKRLVFRTNNTEKATIDTNGNFGIATFSPQYNLDVNGSAKINTLPFSADRDTVLTYDPVTKQIKATLPSVPGTLINVRVLSSGTSYTPTSGTKALVIQLIGGGGGGGGVTGANNNIGAGAGGGGGSILTKYLTGIGAGPYTYSIGSAGSAGANTGGTGGAGGNTTITISGMTYTAPGGSGGIGQTAGTAAAITAGGSGGSVSTNGDVNGAGQPGINGFRLSGTVGSSGNGGSSLYGGGGASRTTAGSGNAGSGYGAGGGGALSTANTSQTGGAGTAGIIIIYEYK